MRAWVREARLVAIILNPAPDAKDRERNAGAALLRDDDDGGGTVMMDELRESSPKFRLPAPLKAVPNLTRYNAYIPLLRYVQSVHPEYDYIDAAYILNDNGSPCLPTRSTGYHLHTHLVYQGYK